MAKAGTEIAATVPPGPSRDRRRRRRRSLYRHISRKCQAARSQAESDTRKTRYELVAHWPDPPILGLIRRLEPSPHGGNGQSNHAQKAQISVPVLPDSHARQNVRFGSKADIAPGQVNVRFTPESGHRNSLTGCL